MIISIALFRECFYYGNCKQIRKEKETEMNPISSNLKTVSIFSTIGLASLILIGYALGIYMNPLTQSLENQDLRRDLKNTQENLTDKSEEINEKEALVNEFFKNYKEVK